MIQHVYGCEMSNSEVNVAVKSFAGENIEDMKDISQPITRRSPDDLILHISTNNLRGSDSPEDLAGTSSLVQMINEKSPNTKETLSGLIIRRCQR